VLWGKARGCVLVERRVGLEEGDSSGVSDGGPDQAVKQGASGAHAGGSSTGKTGWHVGRA
jgi:hypothetical protein